jgi:cell wall-associated NlpC family hydrolase
MSPRGKDTRGPAWGLVVRGQRIRMSHPNPTANFAGIGKGIIMSSKTSHARHRAVPTRSNPIASATRAVSAAGKPAAIAIAASGIMLGAALPAQASGEIQVAPVAAQQSTGSYTVQAGDTLGSIAASHGLNLNDLFMANGLGHGSVIYPGQALSLSVSAAPQQYSLQSATIVATPAPAVAAPVVPAPAPVAEVVAAPVVAAPVAAPAQPEFSFQSASIAPVASGGIVGTAMQGLGGSYVYGGTAFKAWDCSGFVQWAYAQNGVSLPRTTWEQFAALQPTSNPQPGDLVSQNGGSHVGIYLGDGQMISALNPAQGTSVHPVSAMSVDGYYTR